jgi:cytochrome c-type biogenesis protein CcmF
VVLTVGIVLGAQWAYMELGWGGYWAWDPVENASLLPWLTGTALLHSAILQSRRGAFKGWTAFLTAASFFLCIFGTYLTRSGVIQSVHSFGESPIGTFFLVFLGVIAVVSIAVMVIRRKLLASEHGVDDLFSREGFFLGANVILVIMTAVTLIGTIWPIISGAISSTPVSVSAPFYNKVILPMALVLAAMMSTGPVLGGGEGAAGRAKGKLLAMALVGILAAVIVGVLGFISAWALASTAIIAAVLTAVVIDVTVSVKGALGKGPALPQIARAFTARSRHWGAQLAHVGMAAIIAGVVGSSVYGVNQNLELKRATATAPAVSASSGQYTFTFKDLEQVRRSNHTAVVATVDVKEANGATYTMRPERRFFDHGTDPNQSETVVALRMNAARDLYVTLAGWDGNEGTATISTIINPLVSWIWVGGILLTLGGFVCLIPTGKREPAATPEQQPERELPAGATARERRRARQVNPVIATARR